MRVREGRRGEGEGAREKGEEGEGKPYRRSEEEVKGDRERGGEMRQHRRGKGGEGKEEGQAHERDLLSPEAVLLHRTFHFFPMHLTSNLGQSKGVGGSCLLGDNYALTPLTPQPGQSYAHSSLSTAA